MKIRFNLQPWREAQRKSKQQKFIFVTALVAVVTAVVIGYNYYLETSYIDDQDSAKSDLQQQIDSLQNAQKKVEETKLLIDEINKQISSIEKLQNQRGIVLKLLDHIAKETPDNVFLNHVKFDGKQLTIEGVAENDTGVSEFMRAIQSNELLKTAVLRGIQLATSTGRYIVPEDSEIKSFTVIVDLDN